MSGVRLSFASKSSVPPVDCQTYSGLRVALVPDLSEERPPRHLGVGVLQREVLQRAVGRRRDDSVRLRRERHAPDRGRARSSSSGGSSPSSRSGGRASRPRLPSRSPCRAGTGRRRSRPRGAARRRSSGRAAGAPSRETTCQRGDAARRVARRRGSGRRSGTRGPSRPSRRRPPRPTPPASAPAASIRSIRTIRPSASPAKTSCPRDVERRGR